MTIAETLKQGTSWVRPKERTVEVVKPEINQAELVAIRNRKAIDEQMKFVVSKLECCIRYADPSVFIDDTIKPRESWLSRLHLINKNPVRK